MRWPFHVINGQTAYTSSLIFAIKIFNTNGADDATFTAPTTKSCGLKLEWSVHVFFCFCFTGDDRQGWEKWEMTIDIIKGMKNMIKYEWVESEAWGLERRWTELRINFSRYDTEIKNRNVYFNFEAFFIVFCFHFIFPASPLTCACLSSLLPTWMSRR